MPKAIFISHISEDVATATLLKSALERDFLELVEVFVSSDRDSIQAGERWLQSITDSLDVAAMLLVVCSKESLGRPWVNFEAGAAWNRAIPIVPLCHMGLTPGELPIPLSLYKALVLTSAASLHQLYASIARIVGCGVPRSDFEEMAREIAATARVPARVAVPDSFVRRTEAHHNFAHSARNLCVKLMPRKPAIPVFDGTQRPMPLTGKSHYLYRGDFVRLLDTLAVMFGELVPPEVTVWACIRERRSDDCYHTWARSSGCNPTRQEFSEPLHKDSTTIQNLRESYEVRLDCVIVSGSGSDDWHPMVNDGLGEDRSVLMGAVLSKSYNEVLDRFDDPKLNWVVCVNANAPGVFDASHIPLMKACNDVFSWVLNSFIRYDAVLNGWEPRKPGDMKESTV